MTSEATQTTNKAPAAPVGAPCWIEILGVEPEKLKVTTSIFLNSQIAV